VESADDWIDHLKLKPHPEGGYYREIYRSSQELNIGPSHARRPLSTAIYFLLKGDQISALHRIQSDEVWHFYAGHSLTLYVLDLKGKLSTIRLGGNTEKGEVFQAVVPARCWFGAKVNARSSFALGGCTVSPGFDFHDFELAERDPLIKQYPQHRDIITQLTK